MYSNNADVREILIDMFTHDDDVKDEIEVH